MCYEKKSKKNPRSLNASKKRRYRHPENCCTEVWTMARSGCGRSCGIRLSTGRQMSTAATPLRILPSAACVGQKRNSPGSGRRNSRSSRRRAALLLPMPQSKSLLLSREKIPLLPGRSRRALRSVDGSRRARTPRKRPPRSRQKILISAHRQRHRSQWQRNRSGRGSRLLSGNGDAVWHHSSRDGNGKKGSASCTGTRRPIPMALAAVVRNPKWMV